MCKHNMQCPAKYGHARCLSGLPDCEQTNTMDRFYQIWTMMQDIIIFNRSSTGMLLNDPLPANEKNACIHKGSDLFFYCS
jgi:hypothetical protein